MSNVELLWKDLNNPLPGQHNPELPPIRINNYDEWLMEHIFASRWYCHHLKYSVKWVSFEHDPGWYPSEFFEHAQEKVQEFHAEHLTSPCP